MILLIDNLDSFTYNLVQYFQSLDADVCVIKHRQNLNKYFPQKPPTHLVIGPGPGKPCDATLSLELIHRFGGHIPILGVCLGHQCIAETYGGRTIHAKRPMHGKTSSIYHDGKGIFKALPQGFCATRYHSLIVDKETLPPHLEVSAETSCGEIMGLRHKTINIESVQFHPESVLTDHGKLLLTNFYKEPYNEKNISPHHLPSYSLIPSSQH